MLARWRASLRLACRDARRNPGRSLLVIALLALPIFALSAGDVLGRTMQLSPTETAQRTFGAADGLVHWSGGKVLQTPNAASWSSDSADTNGANSTPPVATLLSHLPTGSRVIAYAQGEWKVRGPFGVRDIQVSDLPYTDPLVAPLTRRLSGHAPQRAGDITLSKSLAASLGVHLGDTLSTLAPERTYTVVGIVRDTYSRTGEDAYVSPGSIASPTGAFVSSDEGWYVYSPKPITWANVLALNDIGYVVASREVAVHPPPHSAVPAYRAGLESTGTSVQAVSGAGLLGGMIVLEIILLAGPAFAVGARRSRRTLGLVSAVGGTRGDLRNVVLSSGVVLGVVAGLVGVIGGTVAGISLLPVASRLTDRVPEHIDLRALELGALVVISVVTGLLAAWVPARSAARTDVVSVLRGRRGTVKTPKRVPLIGALMAAVGAVVAIGGGTATHNANVVLAGSIVAELGLIACTPTLLDLAGRLAGALPLSGRIALRDTSRNRSAAAPAVAAIMAAVTGGVAAAIFVTSGNTHDRQQYRPSLARNEAYTAGTPVGGSAADVLAALRRTLPASAAIQIRGRSTDPPPAGKQTVDAYPQSRGTNGYSVQALPSVIVDDGAGIDVIAGRHLPDALAALRAGKAVVFDPNLLDNGRLTLGIAKVSSSATGTTYADPVNHTVPAILAPSSFPTDTVILLPALAASLGIPADPVGFLVENTRAPTEHEVQAAQAALLRLGVSQSLTVETGYHGDVKIGLLILLVTSSLITLGAASIATALSTVDSRPDLITLAAIGAEPRMRRQLSASRAGVIAIIGSLLGVACGFVAPLGYLRLRNLTSGTRGMPHDALPFVVPWPNIAATLLIVPILAMAGAYLFTRSRLPSEKSAAW